MVKELSQEFYQNKREALYDLLPDRALPLLARAAKSANRWMKIIHFT